MMKTITDRVCELAKRKGELERMPRVSTQEILFAALLTVLDEEQERRAQWEADIEEALGSEWPRPPRDPSLT